MASDLEGLRQVAGEVDELLDAAPKMASDLEGLRLLLIFLLVLFLFPPKMASDLEGLRLPNLLRNAEHYLVSENGFRSGRVKTRATASLSARLFLSENGFRSGRVILRAGWLLGLFFWPRTEKADGKADEERREGGEKSNFRQFCVYVTSKSLSWCT